MTDYPLTSPQIEDILLLEQMQNQAMQGLVISMACVWGIAIICFILYLRLRQ